MENSFKTVGISFESTPLEIREKLTLNESEAKQLLNFIRDFTSATDVLAVSTCNRTEIYYNHHDDLSEQLIKGLCLVKHTDYTEVVDFFFVVTDNHETVRRLFNVSLGLEAQVVGDLQIINQIKNAYQWTADENMAGPFLHRLLHTIFFTNKRVVQETPFRDGAASVSYATKELVEELTIGVSKPSVLVLGLGEIGKDVCRHLSEGDYEVFIANRTRQTADELALECGFNVIPFEQALDAVSNVDVIISSIAKNEPILTSCFVSSLNIHSYKYFIDLAVPRSVEKSVENIPGALIYNIDSINNKATKALEARKGAIPRVKQIIDEALVDFEDWSKEMIVSPTIKKLKNALESIRQEELERYVKEADSSEAQLADKITKSMMQKVMKLPVLQLKAACKRGEAETLIDILNDLFDLEKQSEPSSKEH
ncbi:MAG: glutamyl-tRNA reductase [Bacteroidota bacterium]